MELLDTYNIRPWMIIAVIILAFFILALYLHARKRRQEEDAMIREAEHLTQRMEDSFRKQIKAYEDNHRDEGAKPNTIEDSLRAQNAEPIKGIGLTRHAPAPVGMVSVKTLKGSIPSEDRNIYDMCYGWVTEEEYKQRNRVTTIPLRVYSDSKIRRLAEQHERDASIEQAKIEAQHGGAVINPSPIFSDEQMHQKDMSRQEMEKHDREVHGIADAAVTKPETGDKRARNTKRGQRTKSAAGSKARRNTGTKRK